MPAPSKFSSRLAAEADRLCTESRGCLPTATLLGSPSRTKRPVRLQVAFSRGVNYPRSRGALLSVLLFLRSSSSSAEKSVAATERGARPRADLVALSLSFSTLDACKNQKSAPQATDRVCGTGYSRFSYSSSTRTVHCPDSEHRGAKI